MFFTAKKEEAHANQLFRKSCTYHGLNIKVSQKALNVLKTVILAEQENAAVSEHDLFVLRRRGFVRETNDGAVVVTEHGLLVMALAEAGNLVSFRNEAPKKSPPPKKRKTKEAETVTA